MNKTIAIVSTTGALLFGGAGNDVLDGGSGDNQLFGEAGDDLMIWNPGGGTNLFEGGEGNDTAQVNGSNAAETFTITANGTRVRLDGTGAVPFSTLSTFTFGNRPNRLWRTRAATVSMIGRSLKVMNPMNADAVRLATAFVGAIPAESHRDLLAAHPGKKPDWKCASIRARLNTLALA